MTATYSDNSTTDVTDDAIFSGYNMSSTGTQTVTVSYTEGDVTKTTTYSITVSNEENVSFTWNQGSGVSSGYSFTMENGSNKSGYIQDKDGSTGIDLKIAKTNGTALFANTPSTITLTVKVGGGSTKDPLANNVIAYLIDNEGKNIAATQTTVTTKVENQTGTEYSVSMPVSQAYGIRISHVKESGYNVRIYSISFQAE